MIDIDWIRYPTENDDKMTYILSLPDGFALHYIWVRLYQLAGKCNAHGFVMLTENFPYTEEMLSSKLHVNMNTVKLALSTFQMLEMVEIIDGRIFLTNFLQEQNIDGMDKIREQNRLRAKRYRERIKFIEDLKEDDTSDVNPEERSSSEKSNGDHHVAHNGKNNVTNNVTITHCNAIDLDKDIDLEYNNISSENSFGQEGEPSENDPLQSDKPKQDNCQDIFNAWNKINVITHRQITPEIKSDINKALKKSPKDSILKAIERYGTMFHDQTYYLCNYKWGIHEFLSRKEGYLRFLDDGSKWLNYQEHLKNPAPKPRQQSPPVLPPQAGNFKQREYTDEHYERIKKATFKVNS